MNYEIHPDQLKGFAIDRSSKVIVCQGQSLRAVIVLRTVRSTEPPGERVESISLVLSLTCAERTSLRLSYCHTAADPTYGACVCVSLLAFVHPVI